MNKLLFLFAALLVACASAPPATTAVISAWGDVLTLGQTEQVDAPSLQINPNQLIASWIGADETGIHQDARTLSNEGLSARIVLPLPPKNPYAQQMYPASENNTHLLWLDTDSDGQVRLYSALITPKLTVERGPTVITDQTTRRYVAFPNGDGSLWVMSSGGLPIEPRLYAHYIDPQGRPRLEANSQVAIDADWPALALANDGAVYLFWIRPSDGEVIRSTLKEGVPPNVQPIATTITLDSGDRLMSFSVGIDRAYGYVFWNISRANGEAETWFTTGSLDTTDWDMPKRMGINRMKGNFETGFNSGAANPAREGDQWLSWCVPLPGQFEILPAAVVNDGKLGIAYFHGGTIVGYQDIVAVTGLVGRPALLTDRDRFLYLAWSEPTASGKADLKLATLRRF